MPKPITSAKQLVVEGVDEEYLLRVLLKSLGLDGVQVQPMGGVGNLHPFVKALASTSGFHGVSALGVIRDADNDPAGAFESVCHALKKAALPAPGKCLEIHGESPRVGVMLMPNDEEEGALEDLLLKSVEERPEAECVDAYFECLRKRGASVERHESKRRVQAYIASHDGPSHVRLPGEAASASVWPWDSPAFNEVKGFLTSLFGDSDS